MQLCLTLHVSQSRKDSLQPNLYQPKRLYSRAASLDDYTNDHQAKHLQLHATSFFPITIFFP